MTRFAKIQSIALWLHIPMWICCAIAVILIGAYNAAANEMAVRQAELNAVAIVLPVMSIDQLQNIKVSEL